MQTQRVHPRRNHLHGVGLATSLGTCESNRGVAALGSIQQIKVNQLAHGVVDVDRERNTHTVTQAVAAQRGIAAKQVGRGNAIQVRHQCVRGHARQHQLPQVNLSGRRLRHAEPRVRKRGTNSTVALLRGLQVTGAERKDRGHTHRNRGLLLLTRLIEVIQLAGSVGIIRRVQLGLRIGLHVVVHVFQVLVQLRVVFKTLGVVEPDRKVAVHSGCLIHQSGEVLEPVVHAGGESCHRKWSLVANNSLGETTRGCIRAAHLNNGRIFKPAEVSHKRLLLGLQIRVVGIHSGHEILEQRRARGGLIELHRRKGRTIRHNRVHVHHRLFGNHHTAQRGALNKPVHMLRGCALGVHGLWNRLKHPRLKLRERGLRGVLEDVLLKRLRAKTLKHRGLSRVAHRQPVHAAALINHAGLNLAAKCCNLLARLRVRTIRKSRKARDNTVQNLLLAHTHC